MTIRVGSRPRPATAGSSEKGYVSLQFPSNSGRILSEAAAFGAREVPRHKAQILTGLQAAALKDDASVSAGLALLQSIMVDLTPGGEAA